MKLKLIGVTLIPLIRFLNIDTTLFLQFLGNINLYFLLRASSFIMSRRVIGLLKQKFIFKKKKNIISFNRRIDINQNSIVVVDRFDNRPVDCIFTRALRSSKRHVASADSFYYEDLSLGNCQANEKRVISNNNTIITTTYLLSDWII